MLKKFIGVIIFLCIIDVMLFSQENDGKIDFSHRMTIGTYYSYTDNNIGIMEPRYDFIVNFPYLNPDYNILDFGIGLSVIMAFDRNNNVRMPTFGFAINGNMRLYTPPVRKARLFTEGGMSFLAFTKNYPENGSKMNFALHVGGGLEYKLADSTKLFTTMDWFHISNNDIYGRERNPSINAIGINAGIQF
jgi:opacity protein-like surface antigen